MKKTLLVITAALSMLLTQCKKSEAESPSDGKPVNITLNVGGNSKVNVNPGTGEVKFSNGDKIYVASGDVYVGELIYNNSMFSGTITDPTEGEPLQFFFLGNKTPNEQLTAGTTDEFTINISDQSSELPVISYAPSKENYSSDVTSYSAFLLNKCALVKFNVSNYTGNGDVSIKGMNNQVTVTLDNDNDNDQFSYGKIGDGEITLNKNNNEYWAILLPQDAVEGGEAHSSDGWTGTYDNVPAITINGYLNEGIAVNLTEPAPMYTFTINADDDKVEFSPGNLYYDGTSWHFEAHQWDYRTLSGKSAFFDGIFNTTPTNHWGLFGWSGNGAIAAWGMSTSTTYSDYSGTFEDWGTNVIDGDAASTWRTLKLSEWEYLLTTRKVNGNTGFGYTCVWMKLSNNVEGLIIFPDGYTGETTNLKEIPDGAVFLPAAGWFNNGSSITAHQTGGYYRSSEKSSLSGSTSTYTITFDKRSVGSSKFTTIYYKYSVRLVRDCSK